VYSITPPAFIWPTVQIGAAPLPTYPYNYRMDSYDLIVVGGGAAGFFGAITCAAARPGSRIKILEKGNTLLGKVLVSGGGRCNVTHACFDPARLVQNYPRGGRALRGPLERFQPRDTVRWFERRGVAIKTEADGRMFPVTDSSLTIADTLTAEAERLDVEIEKRAPVVSITQHDGIFTLAVRGAKPLQARVVLLASGGERSGFQFAQALGHSIQDPVPSLFTFKMRDPRLDGLAGLSVPNVRLKLQGGLQTDGPLLVTHWGISGPAVLKLSAWGARLLYETEYQADLLINWLPDFNQDSLFHFLLEVQSKNGRKRGSTQDPAGKLPQRLWKHLVAAAGITEEQSWSDLSRKTLNRLADELTLGRYRIQGKGEFKEEFVTCGGVTLKEVDFKTMHSRVCPGLYLAGEVLDIDGLTGGYNFQNAWTTAWIAGQSIAQALSQKQAVG
jgi:predicted Rossmann fold flavoprotein